MSATTSTAIDQLLDRQAIIDCIMRYTRGVDRLDEDLILSAFHEDAIDYHGSMVGSPQDFIAWLWPRHQGRVTQHYVTNHTFDFHGDSTAHVETYFFVPIRLSDNPNIQFVAGRYIDRFEKRDGEWKIFRRIVVTEWLAEAEALPVDPIGDLGRRNRDDLSYIRPLETRPDLPPR